jgi:hypothetical protein
MTSILSKPFYNDTVPCTGLFTNDEKIGADVWNWGKSVAGKEKAESLRATAKRFRSEGRWTLPISTVLIRALYFSLYNCRFRDEQPGPLFGALQAQAKGFSNHIILRLDDLGLFETGRPIAHIIVDVIECISFLRQEAKDENDEKNQNILERGFVKSRKRFWWKTLSMSPFQIWCSFNLDSVDESWVAENWKHHYSQPLSHQIRCIFKEVRNLLLLDPNKDLGIRGTENNSTKLPYFRAWAGEQKFREQSLMRSALPPTFRGDLYASAGIKPGEVNPKETAKANLADFRTKIILKGAFKIDLTNDPSLHLRFDETDVLRPTLLILDTRTISILAILDLTGFMA